MTRRDGYRSAVPDPTVPATPSPFEYGPAPRVVLVGPPGSGKSTVAEALARKIADETARSFKCGSDKPQILGKRGPGFSGPAEN